MENVPSDLNSKNLEKSLAEDVTLVDYFNTFLSLPCFPQRIFYNKELDLLEQFSQKLVKDENNNVQISSKLQQQQSTKYGSSYKTVQISYCVTILHKKTGFEWLKKYRLPEFLKSKLYAEYKLSKILSAKQAIYIETVKNDIRKAKDSCSTNHRTSNMPEVSSINELQTNLEKTVLNLDSYADMDSIYSDNMDSEVNSEFSETININNNSDIDTSYSIYNNNNNNETVLESRCENGEENKNKPDGLQNNEYPLINEPEKVELPAITSKEKNDLLNPTGGSNFDDNVGSDVMHGDVGNDVIRNKSSCSDVILSDVIESDIEGSNGVSSVDDSEVGETEDDVSNVGVDMGRPFPENLSVDGTLSSGIGMSPSYLASPYRESCRSEELEKYGGEAESTRQGGIKELKDVVTTEKMVSQESCYKCNAKRLSERSTSGNKKDMKTFTEDASRADIQRQHDWSYENDNNSRKQDADMESRTSSSKTCASISPKLVISSWVDDNDLDSVEENDKNLNMPIRLKNEHDMDSSTVSEDFANLGTSRNEAKNWKGGSVDNVGDQTELESDITSCQNNREDTKTRVNTDVSLERNQKSPTETTASGIRLPVLDFASFKSGKEVVTDSESEKSSGELSSGRNILSSSRNSTLTNDTEVENDEELVDLSTKTGMDKLKEFLTNTKGECLLLFWLEVELWKRQENDKEKKKVIQDMKDTFLRNGSPFELPGEAKRLVNLSVDDPSKTQRNIIQPLHTYWCPRFTVHQLRSCAFGIQKATNHDYNTFRSCLTTTTSTRKAWPDLAPRSNTLIISSFNESNPNIIRPHSCTPPERCERARKGHIRSKSANPRIITTPYHTNAGKKQLELYATPPLQYGFHKRPMEAFPPPKDQDYVSPVRLFINPLCKPQNAWTQSQAHGQEDHQNVQKTMFQESLVDALMYNSDTGSFFKEYIDKQNNKLWENCLMFWQALMEYSFYFESDQTLTVKKQAQWIYARYLSTGSDFDVQLGRREQEEIKRNLDPAYEDVFDIVEEHVLACLKEPWDTLCRNELRDYDMVPKKETLRYLEVNLKQRKERGKRLVEESGGEDESQRENGKFSVDEANRPLPVPKDGVTFETVIKDREELEGFQKFLEKKDPKGVKDLRAWTDMETFQRIPKSMDDKRNKKAKDIRQAYLNSKYFFGLDSPATKEAQNLILSMNGSPRIRNIPSVSLISECQKYVRCRIERRWLALYKESEEYKERQNPKHQISEAVEDIMLRRRLQRSEAAWRVLNSRWVSSSRDIVALRQTLNNPESCLAFRKFVALKGDTYENDVLFWIEVQKYKDLCHRHASEKCIKKKINAITNCFITSSIPPELQIDVPIEMAEKLMERVTSRNQNIGPYLFREVQMTVFRVLFNMWKEFCTFRSTIKDNSDNLLDVLEKSLRHHRLEARLKRESNERKKLAKQEAEKKRKEREEKERKDLKSMEQLVSLMTSESLSWDREEEDVVLWRYSKHIAGTETSVRKRSTALAETSSLLANTNQPSMGTKSINNIPSTSVDNDRKDVSKSTALLRCYGPGSFLTNSLYSNESGRSKKVPKSSKNLLVPRIPQAGSTSKSGEMREEKIPGNEKTGFPRNQKHREKSALLKNRRQKDSHKRSNKDVVSASLLEHKDQSVEISAWGEDPEEKSPVKANPTKRRVVDSSGKPSQPDGLSVDSRNTGRMRTNILGQKWIGNRDRVTSPIPLTSELLKDFTNSPEGAPLDVPLPLIRISETQSINTEPSVVKQTKEKTLRVWEKNDRVTAKYRREQGRKRTENFVVPDVIVN